MLALVLWSLTAYSGPPAGDIKEAQDAVIKLMESMNGKKGNVKGQVAAIKKKFTDLEPIMYVYKPRKKGGLGMGKDGDSIEIVIGKIGDPKSKVWTAKKRLDTRKELARVAELSRAVAEVTDAYAKQYKDNNGAGKVNPAEWKEFADKMRQGADELSKAAKGDDADKIQKAANNLSASCTDCHSKFRTD